MLLSILDSFNMNKHRKVSFERAMYAESRANKARIGLIPFVMLNDHKWAVLGESGDEWTCDWGGGVHRSETLWYALRRELREEATSHATSFMYHLAHGTPIHVLSEEKGFARILSFVEIPVAVADKPFWSKEGLSLKFIRWDLLVETLKQTKFKNNGILHLEEILCSSISLF